MDESEEMKTKAVVLPPSEDSKTSIASPEGALSFLFAIFALLMWYISVDHHYNLSTLLSIGLTWLMLSTGALIASLVNIIRGSSRGNTNLLATILLGFFPGINTVVTILSVVSGFRYSPSMVGYMYIIGAVFVFGSAIPRIKEPAYIFFRTLAVALGLFFVGLGDVCSNDVLLAIGGWFLFAFALLSFYHGLSVLYAQFDRPLPQGRSVLQMWRAKE